MAVEVTAYADTGERHPGGSGVAYPLADHRPPGLAGADRPGQPAGAAEYTRSLPTPAEYVAIQIC